MAEVSPFARRSARWRPRSRSFVYDGRLDVRTRHRSGGVGVVTVAGEVDLANVGSLRNALLPEAEDRDTRLLVCDLTGVSFLACSGITVLLTAQSLLHARDARIRVVANDPAVLRPLIVTDLLRVLPVSPDIVTALRDG